jgi:hypothetical protein
MMAGHLLAFGPAEAILTGLAFTYLESVVAPWQPDFEPARDARGTGYRRWGIIVLILILLSPLGILLPAWLGAGSAWGEWSGEEIAKLTGHLPRGMAALAGAWKAPVPDYGQDWQGASAARLTLAYLGSALLGVAVLAGGAWAAGRLFLRRRPSALGPGPTASGPSDLSDRSDRSGPTPDR